jgi:hypothetical protein
VVIGAAEIFPVFTSFLPNQAQTDFGSFFAQGWSIRGSAWRNLFVSQKNGKSMTTTRQDPVGDKSDL